MRINLLSHENFTHFSMDHPVVFGECGSIEQKNEKCDP